MLPITSILKNYELVYQARNNLKLFIIMYFFQWNTFKIYLNQSIHSFENLNSCTSKSCILPQMMRKTQQSCRKSCEISKSKILRFQKILRSADHPMGVSDNGLKLGQRKINKLN